jgi:uncharacterized surface protein with fasciclin (FAS1) repeats
MRRVFVFLFLLLVILAQGLPLQAQETPPPTIAAWLKAEGAAEGSEFSLLLAAMQAADPRVLDFLNRPWGLTFFAPTNTAIEAALAQLGITPEELLGDQRRLTAILFYHIVNGQFSSEALAAQTAAYGTFVTNTPLIISGEGGAVSVGGANVTQADIPAANGVIHVIDAVLLPTPGPDSTHIYAALVADGRFSLLIQIIDAVEPLKNKLVNPRIPYTFFAPTDEAIQAFLDAQGISLADLLATPETLQPVLFYHVLGAVFDANVLANTPGGTFATQQPGTSVEITAGEGGALLVDGVVIAEADIRASNGIIHVIEGLLLPN